MIDMCDLSHEVRDILDETADRNSKSDDALVDPFAAINNIVVKNPNYQTDLYRLAFTLMGFLDVDIRSNKHWVLQMHTVRPNPRFTLEDAYELF